MGRYSTPKELLRLTIHVSGHDCWTRHVTDGAGGKLFGHGTHVATNDRAEGRYTVYGETLAEIDSLIDAIAAAPLTRSVHELDEGLTLKKLLPPGNPTREIFVTFDPRHSIGPALEAEGFLREEPIEIEDGVETWTVVVHADREEMYSRLSHMGDVMDAEIEVSRIAATRQTDDCERLDGSLLSERQREVFEHARTCGYYTWPRETTVTELATDLDVSKTTMLEHLRKAEAKLLNQH